MLLYVSTIILVVASLLSFRHDPRNLLNAFLFLGSFVLVYFSVVSFVYERFNAVHDLLLVILYGAVPGVIVLSAFFLVTNGFVVLQRERKCLGNALSLLMGLGILAYAVFFFFYMFQSSRFAYDVAIFRWIAALFFLSTYLFGLFLFSFVAFMSYSILYLYLPKKKDYDYIIIHGSGLAGGEKVTPLLRARIDKAIEAYHLREKPDVKLIASGGKGEDEKISEARAIADVLLGEGIPQEHILLEERSISTWQNLKYSKELAEQEMQDPKYLFISNNYHVFRATVYARRLQMRGNGVGAKTTSYYIPTAFIREYLAILNRLRRPILISVLLVIGFMIATSF